MRKPNVLTHPADENGDGPGLRFQRSMRRVALTALGLMVLLALGPAGPARAATIEVTTEVDVVNEFDGEISLREAILMANAEPGSEILFSGNHVLTNEVLPPITADGTALHGVGGARIDGTHVSEDDPDFPCFDPTGPVRGPAGIEIAASRFTLENVHISGFLVGLLVLAADDALSNIEITGNTFQGPGMDAIRLMASGNAASLDRVMVADNTIQGSEESPLAEGVVVAADWFSSGSFIQRVQIKDNAILDLSPMPFCPPFVDSLPAVGVAGGSFGQEIFGNSVELEASGNTIRNSGTPGGPALSLVGSGFDCGTGFGNEAHASWEENTVENYENVTIVFGSLFANGGTAFVSLEDNVGESLTGAGVSVIGGLGDAPGDPPAQCTPEPFPGTGAFGTAEVEAEDNVFRAAPGLPPFVSPVTLFGGLPLGNSVALSISGGAFRDFTAGPFVLDAFFPLLGNTVVYTQEDVEFINTPDTITVIQNDPKSTVTVNVDGDDDD
jgi:hypothetical protein